MKVELPFLAEGVEGGDVVHVLVHEGDQVTEGQTLLELETDKATVPVPAPAAGKVVKVLARQGDHLKVGQALVELEGNGKAPAEEAASQQTTASPSPPEPEQPAAQTARSTAQPKSSAPSPQPPPAVEAAHAKAVEAREKPPAQPSPAPPRIDPLSVHAEPRELVPVHDPELRGRQLGNGLLEIPGRQCKHPPRNVKCLH